MHVCGQTRIVLDVKGVKPLEALKLLRSALADDPNVQEAWRSKARVAAVLGSCPRSLASLKSGAWVARCWAAGFLVRALRAGIRHWIQYIEVVHGTACAHLKAFPPNLDDVLGWSHAFRYVLALVRFGAEGHGASTCMRCRSLGTFANYLGYLRTACLAMGVKGPEQGHPALKRAMVAIVKREMFEQRSKKFIDKTFVTNIVLCVERGGVALSLAMLWLASYLFLLRVPSEACVPKMLWCAIATAWCARRCLQPNCAQSNPRLRSVRRLCGEKVMRSAFASGEGRIGQKAAV